MGGVEPVPCEGFLDGGLVPASRWMGLALVFLEGSATSSGVLWGIHWLGMALSRLSANLQSCVPVWRIDVGLLALELAGFWVDLGLSVEMEAFGRALDY